MPGAVAKNTDKYMSNDKTEIKSLEEELKAIFDELTKHEEFHKWDTEQVKLQSKLDNERLQGQKKRIRILQGMLKHKQDEIRSFDL